MCRARGRDFVLRGNHGGFADRWAIIFRVFAHARGSPERISRGRFQSSVEQRAGGQVARDFWKVCPGSTRAGGNHHESDVYHFERTSSGCHIRGAAGETARHHRERENGTSGATKSVRGDSHRVLRRTNGTLNERREENKPLFSRQRLLENMASPFHSFVFYAGARHEHARATQRLTSFGDWRVARATFYFASRSEFARNLITDDRHAHFLFFHE